MWFLYLDESGDLKGVQKLRVTKLTNSNILYAIFKYLESAKLI